MTAVLGAEVQLEVWTEYFQNIKAYIENAHKGVMAEIKEQFHENLGNMENPWRTR